MNKFWGILLVVLSMIISSCSKTPNDVISEGEMANLLADLTEADAIVEINRTDYDTDEKRQLLKQAILEKHGVTQDEFNNSLMWYGRNLDIYDEVYDNVISILETRQKDAQKDAQKAGEKLIAAGDSVDIWQMSHSFLHSRKQAGENLQLIFSYDADGEMRNGDRYKWQFSLINNKTTARALIGIDYTDGSTEYQTAVVSPESVARIELQTDSTKSPKRIYGYLRYQLVSEDALFIDQISLSRSRLNKAIYNSHPYQYNRVK